jgi:hypothetical protein
MRRQLLVHSLVSGRVRLGWRSRWRSRVRYVAHRDSVGSVHPSSCAYIIAAKSRFEIPQLFTAVHHRLSGLVSALVSRRLLRFVLFLVVWRRAQIYWVDGDAQSAFRFRLSKQAARRPLDSSMGMKRRAPAGAANRPVNTIPSCLLTTLVCLQLLSAYNSCLLTIVTLCL